MPPAASHPISSHPISSHPTASHPTASLPTDPHRTAFDLAGRPGVPRQVGPFSHAVAWGNLLFVTGQMPTDSASGLVVVGGVVEQTRQVLRNLGAVIGQAQARWEDILMVRIYLADFSDYGLINAEYERWFAPPRPARTCVGVTGLAVDALIEIDLVVGLRTNPTSPTQPLGETT